MKLSREKVLHLSHQILGYLDKDDGVEYFDEPALEATLTFACTRRRATSGACPAREKCSARIRLSALCSKPSAEPGRRRGSPPRGGFRHGRRAERGLDEAAERVDLGIGTVGLDRTFHDGCHEVVRWELDYAGSQHSMALDQRLKGYVVLVR
jgi:hypothetical protein